MKLLMISGDRSVLQGKKGAFWYTLEEFRKHWERIDVICPRSEKMNNGQLTMNNKIFENVFFHPSPYGLLKQQCWILEKGQELITQHHHDVMTAHDYPPFYNGIGACKLHKRTKIPYALEVHHIVGHPRASSFTEWIGRVLSRWQIPKSAYHAKAVRVVNEEVRSVLKQWGIPGEKIHVVHSIYLDHQALVPDDSIAKKYDLVCCGRLVANKGIDAVIQAVSGMPDLTLLVIGDGPLKSHLEAKAPKDRITFTGWLNSNDDVYKAIQSAKIFIMNSRSEGGPRVAIEAMALGMPLLTTKVGLMPEVIQENVTGVFTTGDPTDLKSKMTRMLRDHHLHVGSKEVLKTFERKNLIQKYATFLQSLAR